MKSISSIEIKYLVHELKNFEGSKVNKIYNKGEKDLVFQLHSPKSGRTLLKILDNRVILEWNEKETYDPPSNFCQSLRKHLEGAILKEVRQIGSERVIELLFDAREANKILIVESFSNGNIILCDGAYIVFIANYYHKWKDREIRPKSKYEFPLRGYNLFDLSKQEFEKIIHLSTKESVVKSLALDLSIGGLYSEELCLNSKVNKNSPPISINKQEIELIYKCLKKLISSKIDPSVISQNGEIIDVIPIKLEFYKEFEQMKFKTYSEAFIHYIKNLNALSRKDSKYKSEKEKIEGIIKKQEEKIKEMWILEQEFRKKGELIYERYQFIEELLNQVIVKLKTTNLHNLKKMLKDNKLIKEIDPKEKMIEIEL